MIVSKRTKSSAMAELMGEIDAQMGSLRQKFNPGEKVHGTILSVGTDFVVLDINSTMQGIVERTQWEPEGEQPVVGEEIDAYFIEAQDGAARLALDIGGAGSAINQSVQQAYLSKLPLEGRIEKEINGGYEVTIAGQRAFCPFSQVGLHRREDSAESPIGRTMTFLVSEYDPREKSLVVSHRALLERERASKRDSLKAELKEGDIREGVVTSIMPFGVFVDVGGIEGLIPMRELSWDRSVKAEDLLKVGQGVKVSILSLDWEANRFSFSLRDTLENPWTEYAEEFGPGSYVTGTLVKLMPFGAFVMLKPGVEGLVPISRLGSGRRISHPQECVKEGEVLDLQIDTMDSETKRISLKVVDNRVKALNPGELAVAAHVKGVVEGIRDFGLFVRLSEDKTGLVHVSECDIDRGGSPAAKLEMKYPLGSEIDVVIKGLEGDRISLTFPGTAEANGQKEEEEDLGALLRSNNQNSRDSSISSIGNMLDQLFKK